MSSYQATVEFDSNQESGDSALLKTAEVIVEYDPESVIFEESNAFDSELHVEGLYLDAGAIGRRQMDHRIRQRSIGG